MAMPQLFDSHHFVVEAAMASWLKRPFRARCHVLLALATALAWHSGPHGGRNFAVQTQMRQAQLGGWFRFLFCTIGWLFGWLEGIQAIHPPTCHGQQSLTTVSTIIIHN